jgi:hypothetical protein
MIAMIAGWLVPIVGKRFSRAAAIAALVIVGVPLLLGLLWGAKALYDASVIENAVNEANAEFGEDKDAATGRADAASQARIERLEERLRQTEDLVDEAIANDCAVGEYLASNGARCVRDNEGPVPGSNP